MLLGLCITTPQLSAGEPLPATNNLITQPLSGSIDGIQLARLSQGQVYDVNTSLGCYLLSEGMAEPAPNDTPTENLGDTGAQPM